MKLMMLFLLSITYEPCFAQDSLPITHQQLQKAIHKAIFYQPVEDNKNFVITYLRRATDKKAVDIFFHHRVTNNKTPAVACCQISKAIFFIDQNWLSYNFNAPTGNQKVKKITDTAGDLLDAFFMEYSIQNKRNY